MAIFSIKYFLNDLLYHHCTSFHCISILQQLSSQLIDVVFIMRCKMIRKLNAKQCEYNVMCLLYQFNLNFTKQ